MLIHHTFAPHVTPDYLWQSLKLLLTPWNWRRQSTVLEEELSAMLDGEAITFASGREALLGLLRAMNLSAEDEVIVPAFTCIALTNAIRASGATVVLADIDSGTLGGDTAKIKQAITPRTRAIIQQHTFGITAETEELSSLCREHGLLLIEDCAHIIPDQNELIGDVILLSFGRDKAISGIIGGALVIRNPSLMAMPRPEKNLRRSTVLRLLTYPLIYTIAKMNYRPLGRALLWGLSKIGWMVPVLSQAEKSGNPSPDLHRMPTPSYKLTYNFIRRLSHINNHRRALVSYYLEAAREHGWNHPSSITADMPLQKFPILVEDPDHVRLELKKENIHLSDGWENCVICPRNCDPKIALNEIPNATTLSQTLLTLPTHPTMSLKKAKKLITLLNKLTS